MGKTKDYGSSSILPWGLSVEVKQLDLESLNIAIKSMLETDGVSINRAVEMITESFNPVDCIKGEWFVFNDGCLLRPSRCLSERKMKVRKTIISPINPISNISAFLKIGKVKEKKISWEETYRTVVFESSLFRIKADKEGFYISEEGGALKIKLP